jgi:predicted N-formylglutamate amidohydrolase
VTRADRPWRAPAALQVVVSCEHASARIPGKLGDLGLPAAVLASHRAFDAGALAVAKAVARALDAPLHAGRWSRLVVDLNRSRNHPRVVPRRVDGRAIRGNALTAAARDQRLDEYWAPWRERAAARILAMLAAGPVLHLSVHSFVERLHGIERRNDIGLLHDPDRPLEVAFCAALKALLVDAGLAVRRNFPYFGNTDGFVQHFRLAQPAAPYLGVEIECNQRLARTADGARRLATALVLATRRMLGRSGRHGADGKK